LRQEHEKDGRKPYRVLRRERVGLQPDIILTDGTPATRAIQRETRTTPIVFAVAADPVASGLVARLGRPGENITGFAIWEASLGGKSYGARIDFYALI
jgi:putative ABC transport system substrate-binding protein